MKKLGLLLVSAAVVTSTFANAANVTGAGSSFAFPIFSKWAGDYQAKTNVGINYQSIGSGAGIKQVTAKTVDFGASDMPLQQEELDKAGLMQFPAIVGGVVPVYNLEGIASGQMKMTGEVLADIYLGKIKKWNDPAIKAINPGLTLPDLAILPVHRADGSGTTFIFTNYLSKVNKDWKDKVGTGTAVAWTGGVGGKGNEGVAANVSKIKGALGYVEYAYVKQAKMAFMQMKNRDGAFVMPESKAFQAAAAYASWDKAPAFYEVITDEPGKTSWPITGATFVLMQKIQDKPENATEVLKYFEWSFKNGAAQAEALDYVPMPLNVVKLIEGAWRAEIKDQKNTQIWK